MSHRRFVMCGLFAASASVFTACSPKPKLDCPAGTVFRVVPKGIDGSKLWACLSPIGDREGLTVEFDPQGHRVAEQSYRDDVAEGAYRGFRANGKLLEEGTFTQGKKTGTWRSFDADGHKESEWTMKDGHREGPFASFYASGEKKEVGTFVADQRSGGWSKFRPGGELLEQTNWKQGKQLEEVASAAPDAGTVEAATPPAEAHEVPRAKGLFAGRPAVWWQQRVKQLVAAKGDPVELTLTVERAKLTGLIVDDADGGYTVRAPSEAQP